MRTPRTLFVTLICLCAAPCFVAIAGSERCLRADVPAPIAFPDGTVYPAGTLTLCVTDYSPVASYHEVRVNGQSVGLLFSRRKTAEDKTAAAPFVLFDKTRSGNFRLVGYTLSEGQEVHSYLLQGEPGDPTRPKRISAADVDPSVEE